jgi:hypothetical protein
VDVQSLDLEVLNLQAPDRHLARVSSRAACVDQLDCYDGIDGIATWR